MPSLTLRVLTCSLLPLWSFAAVAETIADKPGAPQAQVSTDFSNYDCAATNDGARVRHIGQVINNTYREWTESYASGAAIRMFCVTQIRPEAKMLSRGEAEALLVASTDFSGGVKKSASASEGGVEKAQTVAPGFLPRGVDSTGVSASGVDTVGAPTTLHSLSGPTADGEKLAVLDLGFPRAAAAAVEKAQSSDVKIEKPATIGVDDRTRVGDTADPPWQLIGRLIVTWKDGSMTTCTGTLVSAYVVLTAGQCAHNRDKGGWAARASFAPGQMQDSGLSEVKQPFDARVADYVETNSRWTQVSGGQTIQTMDARSDYAAYYFVQPWTHVTTFMGILYDDTTNGIYNTAGYPVEAGGKKAVNQAMWYSSGTETSRSKTLLKAFNVREFTTDVSAGQSGSPFWTYDGSNRKIVGVVSYGGDEVAGGVAFGGENKTIVTAFATWQPGVSAPSHTADNLRVPIGYPSSNTVANSYLRIYNPTPQAGTVTIRFANGETGAFLATWTSPSIPPFATRQFTIDEVEAAASPAINAVGKDRYTLNISSTFLGFFQHVLWNKSGQSITNVSGCSNGVSNDVLHLNNVQTSLIPDYPSAIIIHNIGVKTADAIIGVYEAKSGTRIGGIIIPSVPADADAVFGITDVESVLNYKPAAGEFFYNMVLESDFQGYLQHLVYNKNAGLITNMTAKCAMPFR